MGLRKREEQYRLIFELAPHGIVIADAEGTILDCNDRAALAHGFSREEFLGRELSSVVAADRLGEALSHTSRAKTEGSATYESRHLRRNGELFDVAVSIRMITLDGGIRMLVTWEDVSARNAAQEKLRTGEAFNRSLMEGIADGVKVMDLDGRLLFMNATSVRQMGLASDDALLGSDWLDLWPATAQSEVRVALARARAGEAAEFTAFRLTAHGVPRWWSVLVSPVRDPATQAVVRLLAVSRDVTQARLAEQALRQADSQKNEFIATLAHELRNPLAPVRNAVAVLRHQDVDPERLAWCRDVIDRQIGQMSRLLEDLLDVSRITRGRLILRREPLELSAVIDQAIEIAGPAIDAARHRLTVSLPDRPLRLIGDPVRLTQIFSNLLTNAAKYTPEGGQIDICTSIADSEVSVQVRDSGIGLTHEHLPRVFDAFNQVDSSIARSQGGLGIGLALVKGLTEMHGGRVAAASEGAGRGSIFTVTMPLAAPSEALDPTTIMPIAPPTRAAARRIVIVDDNRDSAESLALLLQLEGNTVAVAHDGPQALAVIDVFRPDVVLLDLGLPGMNGYDVCQALRARSWGSQVVIIAVSGWGQAEHRRKSRAVDFDAHLVKPVGRDTLVGAIEATERRRFG